MATSDEEFIRQLREVFDLCDELKCGFISVDQLKDIVRKDFGGSDEEISELIECLDPNRHGVVTFPDFCRGAVAALHNKGSSSAFSSLHDSPDRRIKPKLIFGTPEDTQHLSVNGALETSPASPCRIGEEDSAFATGSDVSRESLAEDKQNSSGSFRSNSSTGSNCGHRRRRCSRPLNRSGSKRLSSTLLASQLHRNGSHNNSRNASRRNSASSDEMFPMDPMSLEDDVIDLNQKVHELQQQVANLSDHQLNTDERYNRVKQENAALQTKIDSLEEQLRELEFRSEDRLQTEQRQYKEIMARHERENKQEVEQYASKLFSLQQEYIQLSEENLRLKAQIDKLRQEKEFLQEQLSANNTELLNLRDDHQRLQEVIRKEKEDVTTERANNNRALAELTKELEHVRQCNMNARSRSPSLLELPAQYRELELELRKVKDENKHILETNEELHAQLLTTSLQEGRSLLHQEAASLADEFEMYTKDQMMTALREQKEVNVKLRAYIDGILLNILENHPQLLEVKNA